MITSQLKFTVIFAVSLFFSLNVFSQSLTPRESLESFLDTMRAMEFPIKDEAKHADLVKKTGDFLDLDSVGEKAVAAHWNQMSEAERKDFSELFSKLIQNIAYRSSHDFLINAQMTYSEPVQSDAGVTINTRVRQKGEEVDAEVLYHLSQIDGKWKIDDVILDDVSIVEDLKYQFDKIIEKSSYSGLIQTMQERLAKAISANQTDAA